MGLLAAARVPRDRHPDVGSGNVGASNVWRTLRRSPRSLGRAARRREGRRRGAARGNRRRRADGVLAGTAALVGHWRPLFLGFARGGKVVATTGGVALAIAPLVSLSAAAVWIVVFLATRYASIASIVAGRARCRCSRSPSTRRGRCSASRSAQRSRSSCSTEGTSSACCTGKERRARLRLPERLKRRSAASL